jgi:hypothetical protein
MARFTCPDCNARVSVAKAPAPGKRLRCPDCGARFKPEDTDEPPPRPRKKKPAASKNGAVLLIGGIVGGVLVLGIVVVVLVVVLSRGGAGGLLGPSKVTAENADTILEAMTVEEVEAILGPGRVCTFADIANIVAGTAGADPRQQLALAAFDDGTTWRLWQNDGLSVMVNFRKGRSGVERVASVQRLTRLPNGAVESRNSTGGHADLDAVAAERVKNQQLLKDPRWKTGRAIRTALVGKWRSPKGLGNREGWDFNADGTYTLYGGFGDDLQVKHSGTYRFVDDAHVETSAQLPEPFTNKMSLQVTGSYQVLVDDKELVFVDGDQRAPNLRPALHKEQMPAGGWNKDKIVGTWQVNKGTPFLLKGARLAFTQDGKVTLTGGFPAGQGNRTGTFEVLDDKLTLIGTGFDANSKETWTIVKLTATELVMKDAFGTAECTKK